MTTPINKWGYIFKHRSYNENLIIYLQEILNELFHVAVDDTKVKYEIVFHKILNINENKGNIIYKINYLYKRNVLVLKNHIFIENFYIINNLLTVNIFNKVFHGLNGEYKLKSDKLKLFTIDTTSRTLYINPKSIAFQINMQV
jgi:hypothetical protein